MSAAICAGLADVLVNDRFAETNSMYSLWLARTFLADGFIVMNGDVLFHPQLLTDLLSSRFDDALPRRLPGSDGGAVRR